MRRAQACCKESTRLFGPDWYGWLTKIQARSNYLLEELTECVIKATASLRRKRNHVPRRNDEVVVIQVFFLKSRNVGSNARCVRHAGLRVGPGVQDDNVEDFSHTAGIEEDVPTYWHIPAGAGFRRE